MIGIIISNSRMSDGSYVYDLSLTGEHPRDGDRVVIRMACTSQKDAEQLQVGIADLIEKHTCDKFEFGDRIHH